MEVKEAIYNRRAVRDYTEETVARELIDILLESAAQAPSAMNEQPWAFVVIQDKSLLQGYSHRAKELCIQTMNLEPSPTELKGMLADPAFNIFYNSTTLIVICASPVGHHPDWDCCLAGQNLMLAAHEHGLGTCPIGLAWPLLELEDVKRELQIPPGYVAVLPIIVGYPKGPAKVVPRSAPKILCWK